jgi:hypothetical protein
MSKKNRQHNGQKIPKSNQNPYVEEEHTTQWPKEKGQKDILSINFMQWNTMYIGKNNTSTNKYNKVFSFQSTCIRFQLSLFFWPNYVPTFVAKFKHTFTTCLHDRIISLRGGEVCVHKTSLTPATFHWSACTKPGQKVSMYLCVRGIDFVSFYDFDIWFWKCSVSVVFLCFAKNYR